MVVKAGGSQGDVLYSGTLEKGRGSASFASACGSNSAIRTR